MVDVAGDDLPRARPHDTVQPRAHDDRDAVLLGPLTVDEADVLDPRPRADLDGVGPALALEIGQPQAPLDEQVAAEQRLERRFVLIAPGRADAAEEDAIFAAEAVKAQAAELYVAIQGWRC